MRFLIVLILNSIVVSLSFAQEKKFIRQGNASYETEDYDNSELKYRKALEKNATSFDAGFNLGDALFKQEKYEEAAKKFEQLAHSETSKENKAKAFHNLGNTLMMSKDEQQQPKLEESIAAYKNALRNNPADDETRYNLAFAQKMLKQQQKKDQENKDDKNKDDKKDENKDQQDQDKKDDKKEDKKDEQKDKQDQNKDQQNKPQDQKKEEKKEQQIPKEKAEQMLKALENDEKDLQKKMKMQKVKGQKVKIEKDW